MGRGHRVYLTLCPLPTIPFSDDEKLVRLLTACFSLPILTSKAVAKKKTKTR